MRLVNKVPESWKLFAFPGLKFDDIPRIMEKSVSRTIKNIVLVLGINHRDYDIKLTRKAIDKSYISVSNTYRSATIYITGISAKRSRSLSFTSGSFQRNPIEMINSYLRETAGNDYYIEPLPYSQVYVGNDNVHHKSVTVEAVIKSIATRLN